VAEVVERRRTQWVDIASKRGAERVFGAGEVALGEALGAAVVELAGVELGELIFGCLVGREASRHQDEQRE
jgi:hypothetical protein